LTAVETVLRRERAVVAIGLVALAALAWVFLWRGAGMGMSAIDMTALTLFPHLQPDAAGGMEVSWPVVIAMWWTMMIAMMVPSVAPLVLLYARVLRHRSANGPSGTYVSSTFLLTGYLAAWLLFSLAAATVQGQLEPAGLISEMMLWSRNSILSAAVLLVAGAYQLSPLKYACLKQCRSPVQFLTQYWRPGRIGAFILGARHGAYCVGCCWLLMALLFVGGVMNLVWIAVLTALVLVEKLVPIGPQIGRLSGYVLIVWAMATLIV